MKSEYERAILTMTEFDMEDTITTSGVSPTPTPSPDSDHLDNRFKSFNNLQAPGSWY